MLGMPYVSQLSPLSVEAAGQGGTTVGRVKSFAKIIVRLARTVGGKIGPTLDNMDDLKFTPEEYGVAIAADQTLDYEFIPPARFDRDGSLYIQQDQPLPMSILALMPEFTVGGN